jgi:hypothetical protein
MFSPLHGTKSSGSQGRVIGIATGRSGVRIPVETRDISLHPISIPSLPPSQLIPELFPGVKRLGGKVNRLPLSSAEVMNEWSFTFAPLIDLHGESTEKLFKKGFALNFPIPMHLFSTKQETYFETYCFGRSFLVFLYSFKEMLGQYGRRRLLRHEREWIFCVYNRGVLCYG